MTYRGLTEEEYTTRPRRRQAKPKTRAIHLTEHDGRNILRALATQYRADAEQHPETYDAAAARSWILGIATQLGMTIPIPDMPALTRHDREVYAHQYADRVTAGRTYDNDEHRAWSYSQAYEHAHQAIPLTRDPSRYTASELEAAKPLRPREPDDNDGLAEPYREHERQRRTRQH